MKIINSILLILSAILFCAGAKGDVNKKYAYSASLVCLILIVIIIKFFM